MTDQGGFPGVVNSCQLCGSYDLWMMLDLGDQPLAERMTPDAPAYPLALQRCAWCGLIQLTFIPPQEDVFPEDHPYTTGATEALVAHFGRLAEDLTAVVKPGELVVDIGANDGTLLKGYGRGIRLAAVEPTGQAAKCRAAGVQTWQRYFTAGLAKEIVHEVGRAKVITATNVMAHVPDVHDFMRGVDILLGETGLFVTESHDVRSVLDGLQIDSVYHEHLRYWSPQTMGLLLSMHGFMPWAATYEHTHGGSFRIIAERNRDDLAQRSYRALSALKAMVTEWAPVWGIGATTRASTLIHAAGLDGLIQCVCELPGSEKIGKFMPGTAIPVVSEDNLFEINPPTALLFSWHLREKILPKLRERGYRGQVIVPLPTPWISICQTGSKTTEA